MAVFCRRNAVETGTPAAEATTQYRPLTAFADSIGAVATPEAFFTAVLAPHRYADCEDSGGTVNVTTTPATPAPAELVTFTCGGELKKVFTLVDASYPIMAVTAVTMTGLAALPQDGAELPSPEYDATMVEAGGLGPLQLATPLTRVALHTDFRPAEKTTVPVGPAVPVTVAE